MSDHETVDVTWDGAAERFARLAAANRRAWIEWLDSLTPDESVRVFQELTASHPEVAEDRLPKPEPVVLWRLWRS